MNKKISVEFSISVPEYSKKSMAVTEHCYALKKKVNHASEIMRKKHDLLDAGYDFESVWNMTDEEIEEECDYVCRNADEIAEIKCFVSVYTNKLF